MISFFDGQHFSEQNLIEKYNEKQILDKTELLFSRFREHPGFKSRINKVNNYYRII